MNNNNNNNNSITGIVGLRNLGNTCYMNSIIHCLGSVNLFRLWLLDKQFKDVFREKSISSDDKLVTKLSELLDIIWSDKYAVNIIDNNDNNINDIIVAPHRFKKYINNILDSFDGFDQHDSHEFLVCLLDSIHEDLKTKINLTFPHIPSNVIEYANAIKNHQNKDIYDKDTITIYKAYKYWGNNVSSGHSIITDLFTGLFHSILTCQQCNYSSNMFSSFTTLSLPVNFNNNENITIYDCLNNFSTEELLTNENKYYCKKCKNHVNATKKIQIWHSPIVLIVHFELFDNMENKINKNIRYPFENLNLQPYISKLNKPNTLNYKLCAINKHIGEYDSGHYVADCLNPNDNNWYEYNDHIVNSINPSNDNSYLLFYYRN